MPLQVDLNTEIIFGLNMHVFIKYASKPPVERYQEHTHFVRSLIYTTTHDPKTMLLRHHFNVMTSNQGLYDVVTLRLVKAL